jgi:anti-sigma factor RsiW
MTPRDVSREEIARYLLGNLSEEFRERVEQRLLTEESFFEELLIAEEELIDDYVSGELADEDRQRFEQHFLCTQERRRKLRFAQSFSRYASNAHEKDAGEQAHARAADVPTWAERLRAFWSGPRALRAAVALALVVIAFGALWLYFARTRPIQTFATITLSASAGNRADAVQAGRVNYPLERDALRVYLTLPEQTSPSARYRAELETADGESRPLEIDGQDARYVSVVIPATRLARGRYALRLFTTDAGKAERRVGGSYFFNVE